MLSKKFLPLVRRFRQQSVGDGVRELFIDNSGGGARLFVALCPFLQSVLLITCHLNEDAVSRFQNLKYLVLFEAVADLTICAVFPHLVHLSLGDVTMSDNSNLPFFTLVRFPSLRTLGFGLNHTEDGSNLPLKVDGDLAAQLHILVANEVDLLDPRASTLPTPGILGVKVDLDPFRLHGVTPPFFAPLRVSHIQFEALSFLPVPDDIFPALHAHTAAVRTLKSIELPHSVHPDQVKPALKHEADTFVEEQQRRGVVLLWLDEEELAVGSLVSPELAAWAAEEYKRREVEEAEGAMRRLAIGA